MATADYTDPDVLLRRRLASIADAGPTARPVGAPQGPAMRQAIESAGQANAQQVQQRLQATAGPRQALQSAAPQPAGGIGAPAAQPAAQGANPYSMGRRLGELVKPLVPQGGIGGGGAYGAGRAAGAAARSLPAAAGAAAPFIENADLYGDNSPMSGGQKAKMLLSDTVRAAGGLMGGAAGAGVGSLAGPAGTVAGGIGGYMAGASAFDRAAGDIRQAANWANGKLGGDTNYFTSTTQDAANARAVMSQANYPGRGIPTGTVLPSAAPAGAQQPQRVQPQAAPAYMPAQVPAAQRQSAPPVMRQPSAATAAPPARPTPATQPQAAQKPAAPVAPVGGIGDEAAPVNIIRGMQQTMALPTGLPGQPYVEVDPSMVANGQWRNVLEAMNAGALEHLAPIGAKTAGETVVEGVRGRNAERVANIHSDGSARVANINADGSLRVAGVGAGTAANRLAFDRGEASRDQGNLEKGIGRAAANQANRFTVVPGGQEVVEVGGLPTTVTRPSRVLNNQTGEFMQDGPAGQNQGARAPTAAVHQEAKAAIARGADKAAVNARLKAMGYPQL